MNKKFIVGLFLLMFTLISSPMVFAQEGFEFDDIEIFGLELEKLINFGTGLLATALAVLTYLSYSRSRNKRLLFVTFAFALFAIKGFITGAELFMPEIPLVDPIVSILDFAILASFFLGILKR